MQHVLSQAQTFKVQPHNWNLPDLHTPQPATFRLICGLWAASLQVLNCVVSAAKRLKYSLGLELHTAITSPVVLRASPAACQEASAFKIYRINHLGAVASRLPLMVCFLSEEKSKAAVSHWAIPERLVSEKPGRRSGSRSVTCSLKLCLLKESCSPGRRLSISAVSEKQSQ